MSKFNPTKYKQEYSKQHYKTFKVDLKVEEMEQLNKLLKEIGLTKAQFLREAIQNLKKKILEKRYEKQDN